jgi:hypothetical protein
MGMDNFAASLPVIGGMFDDSEENALNELQRNQGLYGSLQLPQFQDYKPVEYDPSMASATTISEDPMLRSAQMSALNKMAGLADTGLSAVDQAGFENARQMGNQMAASGTAAALQNAEARGVGGSGLEYAMREAASQGGALRGQQAALQQSSDSARQRALYQQAYGSMLGNVRGQDYNTDAANSGILNQFNQYNTGNRNQASLYNVGQQNYGQQYNNDLRQREYDDQYRKVSGQAGANSGMAQGYAAENAANTANRNSNTSLGAMAFGLM